MNKKHSPTMFKPFLFPKKVSQYMANSKHNEIKKLDLI